MTQKSALPLTVGELRKNTRETVRVTLDTFKGYKLVSARVFAGDGDEAVPTKAGLSIQVNQLPALIRLYQEAWTSAKSLGLLDGDAE